MAAQKEGTGTNDWLRWLGERRDGLILGGAVLYGLGYLVWSYNAWRNGLGRLPALEFQYFVAGIVPALVLSIALAGIVFFSKIGEWMRRTQTKSPQPSGRIFKWLEGFRNRFILLPRLMLLIILTALLLQLLGAIRIPFYPFTLPGPNTGVTEISNKVPVYVAAGLWFAAFFTLLLVAVAWEAKGTEHSSDNVYFKLLLNPRLLSAIALVGFACTSLFIYVKLLYPRLPHELGGPQPRCAFVDLVVDQIAEESLVALTPGLDKKEDGGKVVRSEQLNVYFATSEYMLVRSAHASKPTADPEDRQLPLYELHRDVIRVVKWCEE